MLEANMHKSEVKKQQSVLAGKSLDIMEEGNTVKIENQLGSFEIDKSQAIKFESGLIGFQGLEDFALANLPHDNMEQFKVLQSLEVPELSFIVLPTAADTSPLEASDVDQLAESFKIDKINLALLFIITIRKTEDGIQMTMNQRAPVIIDTSKKTGRQFILPNTKYSVQHELA